MSGDSSFPKYSNPDYKEMHKRFGAFLQAQRQHRRMSIEEISQHIRVPPAKLKALEAGEFHKLPKMPFFAGIVKSFGEYIGCDVDNLLMKVKEFESSIQAKIDLQSVGKPFDEQLINVDKPSFYITRRFFLVILLFAVFLFFFWYALDYFSPKITSVVDRLQSSPVERKVATEKIQPTVIPAEVKTPQIVKPPEKTSSVLHTPSVVLEVHSKWPNYIKLKPLKGHDQKISDVLGVYVGPNQPFKLKDLNLLEAQFWGLYPQVIDVYVNHKKLNLKWQGKLANIDFQSLSGQKTTH